MKLYNVCIPADSIKTVVDILKDDLTELCIEESELIAHCAVISAYRSGSGFISFELTDEQALVLIQTLFIYSQRFAENDDDRQYALYDFALRMFAPLTGKTVYDF